MKKNEIWNTGYYKIANVSSIVAALYIGAVFAFETRILGGISIGLIGLCLVAGLVALVAAITLTKDNTSLALYSPTVLFIFYTALMIMDGWKSSNYLLVCLCFCGISCLYSNFRKTIFYVIVQNIAIGVLIARGIPIIGQNVSLWVVLATWLFALFGVLALLLLTKSATITLNRVVDEVISFRNLLTTTENYVAMLDELNQVVYVSKPLSLLTKIEDPELTKGRPLIDLFPGRELKLLAGKMLRQKERYAEDWEFTLSGQKRYFKVVSNSATGISKGTLVNLHDMTYLAERDEIAVMKDSLKIGFFFMDRKYIIQDHYSRFLEEMLSEEDLYGKCFPDLLASSVTPKELDSIIDYFNMIFDRTFDENTLDEINPLNQFNFVNSETGGRKVFQCDFTTVDRGRGEIFVLVTIYDITARTELQERLREEETRRQEEMQSIFELVQVEPSVFTDFLGDVEFEFDKVDRTLKNNDITAHEALVEIYQSVHAIKSNAVILGLNIFGNKVHSLESKIKILREQEEVSFSDMLNLTMDLEKLSQEKEGFKATIEKIRSLTGNVDAGKKQGEHVLVESLIKTANKAAADMEKKIQFIVEDIDSKAVEKGPRRIMKEVLMQLIRNAVAHGIESPEERLAKGKDETGIIRLSIKLSGEKIHVKLGDDGRGLDFVKIRKRAEQMQLIRKEDGNNRELLIKAIFAPGFSTSETEGLHAGRGIGLNLVKDRVRDVKGSIKLQSEPDKGAVFHIFIPMINNESESKAS
jgi:two-component system chemotaxis sensor kinase CheA